MERAKPFFRHCKIVSSFKGHLSLKEKNLKLLLNAVDPAEFQDQSKNPPVAILAIIGPPKCGKTFFTNLLLQFYENKGVGGWLKKDAKEPVTGFHWGSIVPQETVFQPGREDAATSGVYLWPVPFSIERPGGGKEILLVWIMNLVITGDDSEHDKETLEKFLSLACSRITEIIWKNDNVRILEIRRGLLTDLEDAPRPIEAEKICDSIVFINRSGIKSSTKPLTDDEAKDEMKNLVECSELLSTLNDFKHVNFLLMKDCEQDLHNSSGILDPKVMRKEFRSINKIVETIADESEVLPKKFGSGSEDLTLDNMFEFFRMIVDQLNPKSIRQQRVPTSIQSSEHRPLSRTDDDNGTGMPNVPLPPDSGSEPTQPPIRRQRLSEEKFKEEEQARQKSIETERRRHSSSTNVDDVQMGYRRQSNEFGERRAASSSASSRAESSYFPNSNSDKKMEENQRATPSHTSPKDVSAHHVETEQYQSHTHKELLTQALKVENGMTQSEATRSKAEIVPHRMSITEVKSKFLGSPYHHASKAEPRIHHIKIQVEGENENEKMDVDYPPLDGSFDDSPPPSQGQNATEEKARTESVPMDVDLEDTVVKKFMVKEGKRVQDAGLQGEFQEETEQLASANTEAIGRRHSKDETAARKQFQGLSQKSFEELEAKRKEEEEKERQQRTERRQQKEAKEARKKEEEERKRKEHEEHVEVMKEMSTIAITQVRQFLPYSTQNWIRESLTPFNIGDLRKLYDKTRDGVLEESRSKVHVVLWKQFVKIVDDTCRNGCTKELAKIHDAVFSFKKNVDMKFSHFGYFSDTGTLLDEEFCKVCGNLQDSDNAFVFPAIQIACEGLASMFREHNKLIVETEKMNAQNVIPMIKNFYNEEMKRFLRETPFAPTDLRKIHGELRDRCVEAFRKALILGESRANGVVDVQPLKDEINGAYDAHKNSNDTRLKKLQLETNKIIQRYKTQYTDQMENVLKNNPDGLAVRDFQKEHETISNEVKKLLEIDIKNKIRADEPMEEHLKSLQSHIDKYWEVVLKENTKNWNQGQKRLREAERERKRLEAQRKLEEKSKPKNDKKHNLVEPSASSSNSSKSEPGKSRKSEAGNPSLPPIVFQIGSTRVVMGMMVDGKPEVIGNEFKEPHTVAVVGLTNDNKLIYGTEAVNLLDHEKQSKETLVKGHWWIADNLICGEKAWTDNVNIEGDFRKITVEFLIGFLLRKMKLAVETQFGGTSSTAVIAVPFWLSSTQRIQVKDGARVAGFSEVYLVNEASAAAYACATSEYRKETANCIIVLSENSGTFDATVFEYSNYPTKITTIGHCGSYDIDSKKKDTIKALVTKGFSLITDALQFFLGGGGSTGTNHNADVHKDTIRKLCRKALEQAQSSGKHSMSDISSPKETLVICESETYRKCLDNVGREQARRVNDINEEHGVIIGAILLSQAPKEIGYKIKDKIAFNLLRRCGAEQGTMVVDKSYPLLPTNKTCTTTLPRFGKDAHFFQPAVHCEIPIGNLFSVKYFPSTHEIEPNFDLSNEGIFTLKYILARRRKLKGVAVPEYLDDSDYQWFTPNLSEEELTKFASLLDLTQPSPPPASAVAPAQEDPELTEARQNLFQRCNEMIDWFAKNKESAFRSDLARELFTKKVNEAESFTQHPNASVDDLKKQFDALDKYYQKYCAK